jgi:hypothetical protein
MTKLEQALEARIAELTAERGKIRVEAESKNKQAETAPASELAGIALRLAELEAHDKFLVTQMDKLEYQGEQAERQAINDKREALAKARLGAAARLLNNPQPCPNCGFSEHVRYHCDDWGRSLETTLIEFDKPCPPNDDEALRTEWAHPYVVGVCMGPTCRERGGFKVYLEDAKD